MARLTALQLYKYLPATNCGKCEEKSCMAFAVKLVEREEDPKNCQDLTPEGLKKLTEAIMPPVRDIAIGGEHGTTIGGEGVMYRHDLRFFNQTALMMDVADSMQGDEIKKRVELVKNYELERIGQKLKLDGVSVRCATGDGKKFANAVKAVHDNFHGPLVLCALDPLVMKAALDVAGARRPLIYAATKDNWVGMLALAREHKCPLAVHSQDMDELGTMAGTILSQGFGDLVIDPGFSPENIVGGINRLEMARKSALNGVKEFGYPIMVSTVGLWGKKDSAYDEAMVMALLLNRFASMLVFHSVEAWSLLPVVTLRQNIYSDPRIEPTAEPKLYEIGNPDENSPVLLTSNFALTYFSVSGDIESAGVSCYLLVADTEGLAVTVALAAEKLTPAGVRDMLDKNKVSEKVRHKKLIVPGYAARIKGALEDATGWEIIIGPQDSSGIGQFIKEKWK